MKQIALVGSTGSIGQNTLKVVEHLSDQFRVFALAAHRAVDRLAEQVARFRPNVVALSDASRVDEFARCCRAAGVAVPEVVTGLPRLTARLRTRGAVLVPLFSLTERLGLLIVGVDDLEPAPGMLA